MTERTRKKRQEAEKLVVVYARLREDDHEELKRREDATGAPIAAQIRILVHEALHAQRGKIR